jgi:hypothetical protein
MNEEEKRIFHLFVQFLLDRFDKDEDRLDFESFVLVLHHLIQKEQKGFSLDISISQLLHYNGFVVNIPHFGEHASLPTLSWLQRRFYEDIYGLLVFTFGADTSGKMDLKPEDLTQNKNAFYYDGTKLFKDHRCSVCLSSRKVTLMGREFFMTSFFLVLKP